MNKVREREREKPLLCSTAKRYEERRENGKRYSVREWSFSHVLALDLLTSLPSLFCPLLHPCGIFYRFPLPILQYCPYRQSAANILVLFYLRTFVDLLCKYLQPFARWHQEYHFYVCCLSRCLLSTKVLFLIFYHIKSLTFSFCTFNLRSLSAFQCLFYQQNSKVLFSSVLPRKVQSTAPGSKGIVSLLPDITSGICLPLHFILLFVNLLPRSPPTFKSKAPLLQAIVQTFFCHSLSPSLCIE